MSELHLHNETLQSTLKQREQVGHILAIDNLFVTIYLLSLTNYVKPLREVVCGITTPRLYALTIVS